MEVQAEVLSIFRSGILKWDLIFPNAQTHLSLDCLSSFRGNLGLVFTQCFLLKSASNVLQNEWSQNILTISAHETLKKKAVKPI